MPAAKEALQRLQQRDEVLEVVVVRDLAPQPLPDRFDRMQVRIVGRQELEAQPWLRLHERTEAGTAMPGRPIEQDDAQDPRVGSQQLLEEALAVRRREPRRHAAMEPARDRVEGPKPMNLLVRRRPVPGQGLLVGESPLSAERGVSCTVTSSSNRTARRCGHRWARFRSCRSCRFFPSAPGRDRGEPMLRPEEPRPELVEMSTDRLPRRAEASTAWPRDARATCHSRG